MILTPAESLVVRRAVQAYRAMRNKTTRGTFQGETADRILEELHPTPARWAALAALVIERAGHEAGPESSPPSRSDSNE